MNGQIFLAMDLEVRKSIKSHYYKGKDIDMEGELLGYWWNLESCEEAIQLFEYFHVCPVCGAIADRDGVMLHKIDFVN